MRVLNLYACLGGNRLLWDDCQVVAVELDKELAKLYKDRFVNDTVIVADAHEYLLENYKYFDFIWSSPPCPSHSRARWANSSNYNSTCKPIYPDLKLYEEILFLQNYYKGKFCVENVIPYYEPLIPAKKVGRHLYWTNFKLPNNLNERNSSNMEYMKLDQWCEFHNYNFKNYKGKQSVMKIARNLVDYEAGKTIFDLARNIINNKTNQTTLF